MGFLEGRKAIVTGGAMGIGLATARRLLAQGCDVTIWDMNRDALEKASDELKTLKQGAVYAHLCDVTDREKVMALASTAEREMGRVDILINNAGIEKHGRFCDVSLDEWERETAVNFRSILYTTHAILPGMYRRNEGHIVNISSAAGLIGVADVAVYAATKWAVLGLTESLRAEAVMDGKNIAFTSVHPHFIREGLFSGGRLNLLGELLVPRIRSHDVVARAIVDKALRRRRNVVKIPVTLHLGLLFRALLPDRWLQVVLVRLIGTGRCMEKLVGYGNEKHL
ncbi:MAG: SDR family NAD(P)-dependent oxidoreductase [Thermodesulfobacteriota bacterium]